MDFFDQIKQYKNNELSPEERAAFDQEMSQNTLLQDAVDNYDKIIKTLEAIPQLESAEAVSKARARMRREVQSDMPDDNAEQTQTGARVITMRRVWSMAASVVVIIALGSLLFANLNYSSGAQKSYATSLYQPQIIEDFKSTNTPDVSPAREVMSMWDTGNQDQAIARCEQLFQDSPENQELRFVMAHLYHQSGQFESAAEVYSSFPNDSPFKEQAEFYAAVSLIELGQTEAALEVIERITNSPDHPFYSESLKLKGRLSSVWNRLVFL